MMKIVGLPAAVAELVRRGEDEREQAARAERERLRAEVETVQRWHRETTEAVRAAVVAAGVGLTAELAGYLEIPHASPASLKDGYTTAVLSLPGCEQVCFNLTCGPTGRWTVGREGESDIFTGPRPGYSGTHRYATLALAVAAAREKRKRIEEQGN